MSIRFTFEWIADDEGNDVCLMRNIQGSGHPFALRKRILPHEAKDYLQVLNACKDMDIHKLGLCVPKPLQEFCRESLNKDIMIAESSHDLFENNINGHIYLPMVKRFIIDI